MGAGNITRLVALAALLGTPVAQGETPCETAASDVLQSVVRFDPAAQLLSRGLDPQQLRFVKEVEAGVLRLDVRYEGSARGFIVIGEEFDADGLLNPVIENVRLEGQLKGSGLGQILYLAAGRIYFESTGKILRKSGLTTSDADKLWERLVNKGYAHARESSMGGASIELRAETLTGDEGSRAMEFVNTRMEP